MRVLKGIDRGLRNWSVIKGLFWEKAVGILEEAVEVWEKKKPRNLLGFWKELDSHGLSTNM